MKQITMDLDLYEQEIEELEEEYTEQGYTMAADDLTGLCEYILKYPDHTEEDFENSDTFEFYIINKESLIQMFKWLKAFQQGYSLFEEFHNEEMKNGS